MNPKAPSKSKAKTLYVVDAHAYLHRAYHALPPLTTRKGEPVGALFGFAKVLLLLLRRERPDLLAVCFDSKGPTFRHKAYPEYKATRKETDPELITQLGLAREMVSVMGFPAIAAPGYEADDLLATFAREGRERGMRVTLVTGDKDAMQLVSDRVQVLNEARKTVFDAGKVFEKYQVRPEQFVDYLALVGDVSDNVPGVKGIGAVGAAKLLARFKDLSGILAAAKAGDVDITKKTAEVLRERKEEALLSRDLVRLDDKAPIGVDVGRCEVKLEPTEPLRKLFTRFEFQSLLREFSAEPMGGGEGAVELVFKETEPKKLLAAAKKAAGISAAADTPAQPDLLHGSSVMIALALPDGRAAVFADAELNKHRAAIAKLLSSAKPAVCGHDLKETLRLLREAGFELSAPAADTMLAAYCLDPSRGRYGLGDVLLAMGAGKLPAEDPAVSLGRRAAAVWPVRERLEGELAKRGLDTLYRKMELPMIAVLADMEDAGVALDTEYLSRLRVEFDEGIAALKREIDALAGVEINLRSTKQLAEFFYDTLGLPVAHKTKKGGRSTDEEALRALARHHPLPAKVIEYRELTKLQSTYVNALGEKLDPADGRIHSHFNQSGTATGRLSSLDPNLQNIPIRTPLGRKIRRAFRAGKGRVLLSADYSQIDLRVLAHLSGDPALAAAFKKGGDIHRRTAAEVFGVAPAEVDKDMRRRAKAVNFGIVYGQSAHGLAIELGIPRPEAKDIIDRYFARYAGVRRWIDATLETARKEGSVRTLLGRVRELPDIRSKNFQARSFSERVAMNTPIQGTSADIIKAAMIEIHREMAGKRSWKARLILQVHDELIFELPESELSAFGSWARKEMETAVPLDVPLVVDLKAGENWLEMEGVPA